MDRVGQGVSVAVRRGELVFKVHRLLYPSTLDVVVMKKKRREGGQGET